MTKTSRQSRAPTLGPSPGLEERILDLIDDAERERRSADKRAARETIRITRDAAERSRGF